MNIATDLFGLRSAGQNAVEVVPVTSLKGRVGRTELRLEAVDQGVPPMASQAVVSVCVQDINDHAPEFAATNRTIFVPEVTFSIVARPISMRQ